MKYLTTYLDDEINFKFGNNGSIIELKAVDDHAVMSFSNEEKLLIRIKNEESYIKTVPVTAERKIIQLPTKLLKDLTVGQYDVELWQGEGDNQIIYPDEGFLRLKIHGNASQIDGSLVSSITLADFEKKFNELANKIEDQIKSFPDVDGHINVDVKVEDGHLIINGNDTGVDLTAHDGKDGHDGHTPVITVSNKGSLIIDGVDTNKSLIGPRGADGVPGIDGHDGKSAYQVALDNGFDGTEVEWLRSLHGNDGLDGKSGSNGKSAYEIAVNNGFQGTEQEWLESLKGKDGRDGNDAHIDLSEFLTKDTADSEYAKKNDVPLIVYDAESNTLTINGQKVEMPSQVDLSSYVTKTDADKYALKSDVKNIVLDKNERTLTVGKESINIPNNIDLSPYYTKGEIDEKLADIQSGGKIDLSNYVNKQDLDGYAKKSEIPSTPDLTPYETKENAEKTYATKQALADIQLTPGKDGENGKSAYDIAKEHGYTDTEENWLKSLHGRDGIDGKSGQNGVNGLSAYEVAQKNGFSGTEQEWLDSLKGKDGQDADDVDLSNYATKDDLKTVTSNTTRHAPTAWTLDRTTNPWTIWFDNGCGLQFLDYSTAPTVYGYGFSVNTQNTNIDAWPLMGTIISASRGTLTLDNISKLHGSADYWGPNTTVINPIKTDASNYDWSNVYFNDEDRVKSDDYHYNRQRNIFRVMYELGIWSIDDIKPFGLTKKEG